jgi:hypothetical protein
MERREFIKKSGFTTAVLSTGYCQFLSASGNPFKEEGPGFIMPEWKIHENGQFDLVLPGIRLSGCIPSMDNDPVIPLKAEVTTSEEGFRIDYLLEDGSGVVLVLRSDANGAILSSRITGSGHLPHYFYPLSQATVEGADRFFKQGMGFAGPSGVYGFPVPKAKIERAVLKEEAWSHDSYLVSGFLSDQTTLVMGAYDHSRYLQRSTFYNRQHRFGLIDRHLNDNRNLFEAGFSTEGIPFSAEAELPDLHFMAGTAPFFTFREIARRMAAFNQVSLPRAPRYYYCSWYDKGPEFTMVDLEEVLAGLDTIRPVVPIQAIQIDAGYCYLGEWLKANERFPQGMENAFRAIRKAGYEPGVWIGPFMVNSNSFIFRQHKDWLLRDSDGKIIMEMEHDYHTDGSVYVLDSSHPGAFVYLRSVFRQMRAWGVTTYKTDFMDWGLRDSTKVTRYAPGKTGSQYFTEVATMIREEIGEESYWLGCISPYQPLIGKVDAVRVSNDVGGRWNMESAGNMVKEMVACHYMNHVLWQNDPDVLYSRSYNLELTREQKLLIAYFDGIMGGVVNTSDAFHRLSNEELKLWRFTQPARDKSQALLPYWGKAEKDVFVAARAYPAHHAWGVLIVNISPDPQNRVYPLSELIGKNSAYVFDWAPADSSLVGLLDQLDVNLDKQSCRLFYVAASNLPPPASLGLSGMEIKGLES